MDRATVACKHCGNPTTSLGTRECDRCYELWKRVRWDPDLARQALEEVSPTCCHLTMPAGTRCVGCPHARAGDTLVPRRGT